jgi:hypothetical protein
VTPHPSPASSRPAAVADVTDEDGPHDPDTTDADTKDPDEPEAAVAF